MKFACPHCSQRFDIPPQYYGATVNCTQCTGEFTVPNTEAIENAPTEQLIPTPTISDPRIADIKARFTENEFRVNGPDDTPDFPFHFSASKVRFDFVGVPTFLEEFFIFENFEDQLDTPQFNGFLDEACEWAIANENNMPKSAELSKKALSLAMKFGVGGELGRAAGKQMDQHSVRETLCVIYVYAIAIAPGISQDTLDWLWSKKSAAGRKGYSHALFVVPVFYNSQSGDFHHFKKRPILGNVYYTEARKVMKKRLLD